MALWVRQASSNRTKQVQNYPEVENALKSGHLTLDDLISTGPEGPWKTIRESVTTQSSSTPPSVSTPPRSRTPLILTLVAMAVAATALAWAAISQTNAHYADKSAKRLEQQIAEAETWINDPAVDPATLDTRLSEVESTLNEAERPRWRDIREKATAKKSEVAKAQRDAEDAESIWRQMTACVDTKPLDTARLQTLITDYQSRPQAARKHDPTLLVRQLGFVTDTAAMRNYWKTRPTQELTEISSDPTKREQCLQQLTQAWDGQLKEMFADPPFREAYLNILFDQLGPTLNELTAEQQTIATEQEKKTQLAARVAEQMNAAKEIDWVLLDKFPEDYREGDVYYVTASFESANLNKWSDEEFILSSWTQRNGPNPVYHGGNEDAPIFFKTEMAKQLITRGVSDNMAPRLYGILRKRTWTYTNLRGKFTASKLSLHVFRVFYNTRGGELLPGPETPPW